MAEKLSSLEQTVMDLAALKEGQHPVPKAGMENINVFRPDDVPDERKDRIRRHRLWLDTIRKEYPMPSTPYRIGAYIRFFNQTKYSDEEYLLRHKAKFTDAVSLCPLWTLVDFYIDTGGVAPNMESAPEWCRLLDDCFEGKVDLIITQKVSDISRKPQDIAMIARLLAAQEKPVGIYFISENIFTLASYYLRDLHETGFLPEGLQPLPEEENRRLTGGQDVY